MKFSVILYALLGASPYGFGLGLPNVKTTTSPLDIRAATTFLEEGKVLHVAKRADDDDQWTLVLYNAHENGGQCGGTSTTQAGAGGACRSIIGKYCADLKVAANVGIASCTFNFVANEDCNSGTLQGSKTVSAGQDSNGVDLSDNVMFVEVGCETSDDERHV